MDKASFRTFIEGMYQKERAEFLAHISVLAKEIPILRAQVAEWLFIDPAGSEPTMQLSSGEWRVRNPFVVSRPVTVPDTSMESLSPVAVPTFEIQFLPNLWDMRRRWTFAPREPVRFISADVPKMIVQDIPTVEVSATLGDSSPPLFLLEFSGEEGWQIVHVSQASPHEPNGLHGPWSEDILRYILVQWLKDTQNTIRSGNPRLK